MLLQPRYVEKQGALQAWDNTVLGKTASVLTVYTWRKQILVITMTSLFYLHQQLHFIWYVYDTLYQLTLFIDTNLFSIWKKKRLYIQILCHNFSKQFWDTTLARSELG